MGGGKSSGSGGGGMPPAVQILLARYEKETRGLREKLSRQFEHATAGLITEQGTPIVAKALEAQKRSTAQTMRATEERLSQAGLDTSPFGQQILAKTQAEGDFAAGQMEAKFLQQLMELGTGYATGQAQAFTGALPGTRETQSRSKSGQFAL